MTLIDIISKVTRYAKKIIVNDNSSTEAVRITQLGSGPALVVEDETNPDASPFQVESDGKVLIGTKNAFTGSSSKLQVIGFPRFRRAENSTGGTGIACDKARGTIDAPTIVQNGDRTAFIDGNGFNGTDYEINVRILGEVDGTPTSVNMPGRITFSTRQTTILTERMRISANGNVGIGTTNPQDTLHVNGTVRFQGLPTSSSGLSPGDIWNNSGTLSIV